MTSPLAGGIFSGLGRGINALVALRLAQQDEAERRAEHDKDTAERRMFQNLQLAQQGIVPSADYNTQYGKGSPNAGGATRTSSQQVFSPEGALERLQPEIAGQTPSPLNSPAVTALKQAALAVPKLHRTAGLETRQVGGYTIDPMIPLSRQQAQQESAAGLEAPSASALVQGDPSAYIARHPTEAADVLRAMNSGGSDQWHPKTYDEAVRYYNSTHPGPEAQHVYGPDGKLYFIDPRTHSVTDSGVNVGQTPAPQTFLPIMGPNGQPMYGAGNTRTGQITPTQTPMAPRPSSGGASLVSPIAVQGLASATAQLADLERLHPHENLSSTAGRVQENYSAPTNSTLGGAVNPMIATIAQKIQNTPQAAFTAGANLFTDMALAAVPHARWSPQARTLIRNAFIPPPGSNDATKMQFARQRALFASIVQEARQKGTPLDANVINQFAPGAVLTEAGGQTDSTASGAPYIDPRAPR